MMTNLSFSVMISFRAENTPRGDGLTWIHPTLGKVKGGGAASSIHHVGSNGGGRWFLFSEIEDHVFLVGRGGFE